MPRQSRPLPRRIAPHLPTRFHASAIDLHHRQTCVAASACRHTSSSDCPDENSLAPAPLASSASVQDAMKFRPITSGRSSETVLVAIRTGHLKQEDPRNAGLLSLAVLNALTIQGGTCAAPCRCGRPAKPSCLLHCGSAPGGWRRRPGWDRLR